MIETNLIDLYGDTELEKMLRKNTAVTPAIDIDDIDPVAHYRKRASGKYHNCC
ncbi:hypothetical protein J6590_104661 [Homalodisca vitripennis]|nr:hypothetical protein J6590_104661 [Homalodisca vitripennis]